MSHLENTFSRELSLIAAGSSADILTDIPPQSDETRVYTRVTVEDQTTANSDVTIGIVRFETFHKVAYFDNLSASQPVTYDDAQIVVQDDENLQVRVAGATANDVIKVWVFGYSRFKPTPL